MAKQIKNKGINEGLSFFTGCLIVVFVSIFAFTLIERSVLEFNVHTAALYKLPHVAGASVGIGAIVEANEQNTPKQEPSGVSDFKAQSIRASFTWLITPTKTTLSVLYGVLIGLLCMILVRLLYRNRLQTK